MLQHGEPRALGIGPADQVGQPLLRGFCLGLAVMQRFEECLVLGQHIAAQAGFLIGHGQAVAADLGQDAVGMIGLVLGRFEDVEVDIDKGRERPHHDQQQGKGGGNAEGNFQSAHGSSGSSDPGTMRGSSGGDVRIGQRRRPLPPELCRVKQFGGSEIGIDKGRQYAGHDQQQGECDGDAKSAILPAHG